VKSNGCARQANNQAILSGLASGAAIRSHSRDSGPARVEVATELTAAEPAATELATTEARTAAGSLQPSDRD
jgi:hypothetical protein